MSASQLTNSSGSEGDHQKHASIDDKKRKRMLSNRESARRSRMKKQKHLEDLINEISQLQKGNNEIMQRIEVTAQLYVTYSSANNDLRKEVVELTNKLASLDSVFESNAWANDMLDMPDPLLKPWQLPYPSQPIMASSNFFQF